LQTKLSSRTIEPASTVVWIPRNVFEKLRDVARRDVVEEGDVEALKVVLHRAGVLVNLREYVAVRVRKRERSAVLISGQGTAIWIEFLSYSTTITLGITVAGIRETIKLYTEVAPLDTD